MITPQQGHRLVRVLVNANTNETAVQDLFSGELLPLDVYEVVTVFAPGALEAGCKHKWIDMTTSGSLQKHYVCAKCNVTRVDPI